MYYHDDSKLKERIMYLPSRFSMEIVGDMLGCGKDLDKKLIIDDHRYHSAI
jgi:hypothetical protein